MSSSADHDSPAAGPRQPAPTPAQGSCARQTDEFAAGASSWPADLDRRSFLKMLGGSLALAGLAGCGQPAEKILPYVGAPEDLVPGRPDYYATAFSAEGYARGILVESLDGRPIKIEGNPDHPESLGATDAMTQAAVLALYDPDRSRAPRHAGEVTSWIAFNTAWTQRHAELAARGGRGLALLTEPTTSPSELREIHRLLDAMPSAQWYQFTPLARHDLDGAQADHDFAAADVIFAIGSDFLYQHPAALRHTKAFASRRRVESGQVELNRLFVAEPSPTVTGALGDRRLPVSPARLRRVLDAVAAEYAGRGKSDGALSEIESGFVAALVGAFRAHPGTAVCVAGPEQDDDVRRWARAMNVRLGSSGRIERFLAPVRSDGDPRAAGGLAELARAIRAGAVDTLWMTGTNPAYAAPADLDFSALLPRVEFTVHHGLHDDETANLCRWHLPASHFLEAWSDLRSWGGAATLVQPLIRPLYSTRSTLEILRALHDPVGAADYDILRESWRQAHAGDDFEAAWSRWLNRGVVEAPAPKPIEARVPGLPTLAPSAAANEALTLVITPDAKILDGRHATSPWLQELPHQLTHLTWDNALTVSPALAHDRGLKDGDLVEVGAGGRSLEAAVCVLPGQAADCLVLSLGYGRTRAGDTGTGRGFDAYRLRTTSAPWWLAGATLRPLGRRYPLVRTHGHFTMEGRDLAREVSPDDLAVKEEASPSIYPDWPRDDHAWGMSIDLGTCIGCSACVIACQAENNIPTVGKEQVAREREMHWIRVDRYFSGDEANPRMIVQPVPCMQCEHAPCEVVCPVHATVHSSEGLNDMVYNRCVGTRYCSNNCPYKVRRFNFLDFRPPADSPVELRQNPHVTIRERGVMEKCTYCVQRINAGRIAAERTGRRLRDGAIVTACQQACPADAIVFGDLNDPESRVVRRKREPNDYALLGELNTRPRTTYLAKVRPADRA